MSFRTIIEELDGQIQTLQAARDLVIKAESGQGNNLVPTRVTARNQPVSLSAAATPVRRTMSAAVRKKIGDASRKRWRELKKQQKQATA